MAASAPGLLASPAARPHNDDLANAAAIAGLPFTDRQPLDDATDEPTEVPSACAYTGAETGVWYRYDAPQAGVGVVVLDTEGSSRPDGGVLDTVLSIWVDGPDHPLTEWLCNDDVAEVDFTSRLVLRVDPGTTYFVKVGTNEPGGEAVLNARAAASAPANDDLEDAVPVVSAPFDDDPDLTFATWEPGEKVSYCQYGWPEEAGVWYALTSTRAVSLVVDTEGSTSRGQPLDTVLSAWSGGPGHPLEELTCNDDVSDEGIWSRLTLDVAAGETVFVKVAGLGGQRGVVALHVRPLPGPPPNDDLGGAMPIPELPFLVELDSSGATMETGEAQASCDLGTAGERSVWFQYTPAQDGRYLFAIPEAQFTPIVSVWSGAAHPLQEVACSADLVGVDTVGLVLEGSAGRTYWVKVSGMGGQGGRLTFVAAEAPAEPQNDDLADAVDVGQVPFEDRRLTDRATDEAREGRASCARAYGDERAVWYRYEAPEALRLRVEGAARGALLDVPATVSAWVGDGVHPLIEVACASAPRGIDLNLAAGEAVFVKVGPALDQPGTVVVRFEASPAPPTNDNLADALSIAPLPYAHTADTRSATDEPLEAKSGCAFDPTAVEAGAWYRFESPVDARLILDTEGSELSAEVLSVWRGDPAHPLQELTCSSRVRAGETPRVSLVAEAGVPYFVKVAGDVGLRGRLTLRAAPAPPAPRNDALSDAILVRDLPFSDLVDTRTAGDDPGEIRAGCARGAGPEKGVWYVLEADGGAPTTRLVVSTEGSDFDTVLSAWTGGQAHPLAELGCSDDAGGAKWSELTLRLGAGERVYVKAGGTGDTGGALVLSVRAPVEAIYLPYLGR